MTIQQSKRLSSAKKTSLVDKDDCVRYPCQHDGTCDDHENGFTCRCLPGFAGESCSEIVSSDYNVTNSTYMFYDAPENQPNSHVQCTSYASLVEINREISVFRSNCKKKVELVF